MASPIFRQSIVMLHLETCCLGARVGQILLQLARYNDGFFGLTLYVVDLDTGVAEQKVSMFSARQLHPSKLYSFFDNRMSASIVPPCADLGTASKKCEQHKISGLNHNLRYCECALHTYPATCKSIAVLSTSLMNRIET